MSLNIDRSLLVFLDRKLSPSSSSEQSLHWESGRQDAAVATKDGGGGWSSLANRCVFWVKRQTDGLTTTTVPCQSWVTLDLGLSRASNIDWEWNISLCIICCAELYWLPAAPHVFQINLLIIISKTSFMFVQLSLESASECIHRFTESTY